MIATSQVVVNPATPPEAWYYLVPTRALSARHVLSAELAGTPVVAFRAPDGEPAVLSAHCSHLGAHLGGATIVAGGLRCPLHHRVFDQNGRCAGRPEAGTGATAPIRAFSAVEWSGAVFAFLGTTPASAFAPGDATFSMGSPVDVACSWRAILANAFDLEHLHVVHRRTLLEPPSTDRPVRDHFRLRYRSRPHGDSLAERFLRHVAAGGVRVAVECLGGSAIRVESEAGRHRSSLVLALVPRGERTTVVPFVSAGTGGWLEREIRRRIARWLFVAFLRHDLDVLAGMRFEPRLALPEDAVLDAFLNYLDALPRPSFLERGEELR